MKELKQLKQEIPNFFWRKFITIFLMLLYIIINIYLIAQIKDLIDLYVLYHTFNGAFRVAIFLITLMLYFILMSVLQYSIKELEAVGSRKMKSYFLRKIIYKKNHELLGYNYEKLKKSISDSGRIGSYLTTYKILLIGKMITICLILFVLAYYNFMLMLVMTLLLGLIFIGTRRIRVAIGGYYYKKEEEKKKTENVFLQIFSGISVIKQLKTEEYFVDKFDKELLRRDKNKANTIYHTLYFSLKMMSTLFVPLLSILIGIAFFSERITIGELMLFFAFLVLINDPINEIMSILNKKNTMEELYIKYLPIIKETKEKVNVIDKHSDLPLIDEKGIICFKDVQISEKNVAKILENVKENGIVYSKFSDGRIKFVEHYSFLFDGSLYDNICMGYNAPIEEINEVLDMMMLKDFVTDLSLQYNIRENGKNLSTYQRQKISIARILLRKPKYLFLDQLPIFDNKNVINFKNKLDLYAKKNDMTIILMAE